MALYQKILFVKLVMLLLVNVCKNGNTITYKDNSIPLKNNEQGYIDRNCYNDKYL
jgi:hypothetical protein